MGHSAARWRLAHSLTPGHEESPYPLHVVSATGLNNIPSQCLEVVFCIGSLLQTVASGAWTLGFGRAIGGIGIGALSMLCPLFIGEIASPETRGALVALEQFSIVLGVVLGFWVGFATRSLPGSISWRLPLGIQVLPGAVLAGGSMLLPESPRMLVLRGEEKEAAASLERLRNRVGSDDPLIQVSSLFWGTLWDYNCYSWNSPRCNLRLSLSKIQMREERMIGEIF